jgi:DNA-binding transcriptional LysR family regulator
MNFTTDQVVAFIEVARKGSFSKAAIQLGVTQAALSLRIKKLEDSLEKSLFVRDKSGVSLTEAGKEFLLFAETFEGLANEYLGNLTKKGSDQIVGNLRIGCFSTIGRSLVLPAVTELLRKNPGIDFSYHIRETHELQRLLQSGEVDMIFLDQEVRREGLVQEFLGFEEFVFITSKKSKDSEIHLNHDESDLMSYKYYDAIGESKEGIKRRYLDEIYSVMDGVAAGLGVSILPYHLAAERKDLIIPTPKKRLKSPVYLCYKKRSYYTQLFRAAQDAVLEHFDKNLNQN